MEGEKKIIEEDVTETLNTDDALLASLGYKPEFKRNFTPFELFGVSFSIIGLVPSIASVLVYSIPYGGAAAMVWGWATCGVFIFFVALALAELGSAAPTSGGLYYWTFSFSSPKWRRFLSWTVAYCNTIGNISSCASINWGCAVQVMAAASIGSGMQFQPTTGHVFATYCASLILTVCICCVSPRIIARCQTPYVIVNLLLCLALFIALPAATPKEFKNSAKYAFGNFTNLSNWNNGYAFVLSFLSPLWTISSFDSIVHISEEARNANTAVPYGLLMAVSSGIVLGWGVNVVIAFCMGTDTQSIANSPIGQPMATILVNSFGQKGTLAIWSWIVVVQFAMGTSMMTACSRQIFAFSRDGGLPLSKWLYQLNPKSRAPVQSAIFVGLAAAVIGLIGFGGPNATNAIFSLNVICQNVAFSIPIAARFLGGTKIKPGPFSLGIFSLPVAVVAISWMSFTFIVLFFPALQNPGMQGMNYAIVVFGGWMVLATTYYFIPKYGGKYWFTGPVKTIGSLGDDDGSHISDE